MTLVPNPQGDFVEQLVRRHQGSLRGFLLYTGASPSAVDDLVQDVFLAFLSARFEHRSEASTAAFLRKIGRHLLFKARLRERHQPLDMEALAAEEAWIEFEGEDGGSQYLSTLRDCLEALKGRAAETLRLRYNADLSQAEIADRLGLSLSGVKSILVRSRRRLRDCVERRLAI